MGSRRLEGSGFCPRLFQKRLRESLNEIIE